MELKCYLWGKMFMYDDKLDVDGGWDEGEIKGDF